MKKVLGLIITAIIIAPVYLILKPMLIESKEESMVKYLEKEGYTNPELIDVSGIFNEATFKTDSDTVKVRFSRDGLFQLVY
jgi:hypothetical protein